MDNEVGQWILVGIAVAFVAIERAMKIYGAIAWKRNARNRRKPNNPHPAPGDAQVCKDNRDMLVELRTKMKAVENTLNKKK